jgi:hypothetical protein
MTGKFLFCGADCEFAAVQVDDKPWANRLDCSLSRYRDTLAHGTDPRSMTHGRDHHLPANAPPQWLRALGMACLAATTTFLVLNLLWQPGTARYVVRSVVERKASVGSAAIDLERVRAELTSDELLTAALAAAGQPIDPATVRAWQTRLAVYRPTAGRELLKSQVAIELASSSETNTLAVVDQLARQFVAAHEPQLSLGGLESQELAAARTALTTALDAEDSARRELDGLVREHFEGLRRLEDKSMALAPSPPGVAASLPAQQAENPAWTRVNEQLGVLEARRDELLLKMTEQHPLVVDLAGDVEELRGRLARLPRYLDAAGPELQQPAATPLALPAPADAAAVLATAQALAGERGKMRAALEKFETAKSQRLEAQAAVEVLARSPLAVATGVESYAIAESARVAERIPAISPLARYATLLGISSLVLLATAWLARPRTSPTLLRTADDVATLLELPVIAQLRFPATRAAS